MIKQPYYLAGKQLVILKYGVLFEHKGLILLRHTAKN